MSAAHWTEAGRIKQALLEPIARCYLKLCSAKAFPEHALFAFWSRRMHAVSAGTIEGSMSKGTLDNRHRNKDGEISAKHGETLIRT